MRTGPSPLPIHLGLVSLIFSGAIGESSISPETAKLFFSGLKKYQESSYKRTLSPLPCVWEESGCRLFRVEPSSQTNENDPIPLVLIPSVVNGSGILDLMKGRSLLRWMGHRGFDAFLFDWGTLAEKDPCCGFDRATELILHSVLSLNRPCFLLGYCMGGLFTAALSAQQPELIRGNVLLATPWDFSTAQMTESGRFSQMSSLYGHIRMPLSKMVLQSIFAAVDPQNTLKKFATFATMPEGDPRQDLFVAVEDWLNSGGDLPAGIARTMLKTCYTDNAPFSGEWLVHGHLVRAQDIKVPSLVVTADRDQLVPPHSALAFAQQCPVAESVIAHTGHIGLIASASAIEQVWDPIAAWIEKTAMTPAK